MFFFFLHLKDTPKQQTISNHFILLLSPAQFCTSFLQCNCFEISNMATHLLYLFFFFFFLRESRHVRLIKIEASCQCFIKISASCFGDPHMYVALGSLVRFECQKGVATWWLFYFLIFVKVYYGQMLTFNATYVKLF